MPRGSASFLVDFISDLEVIAMAVFDKTTTVSEGSFDLLELDTTGEEGEFEHTAEVDSSASLVGVLIEGEIEEYEVLLEGEPIRESEEAAISEGNTRTLVTVSDPVTEGTARLSIRGFLKAGRRVKISVLKLARRMQRRVSCNGCKRLLRFIVSALLAAAGAPDVQVGGGIPSEFGEWITDIEFPDAVQRIVDNLDPEFWETALEALSQIGAFLNQLMTPFDAVVTYLCEQIGACGGQSGFAFGSSDQEGGSGLVPAGQD